MIPPPSPLPHLLDNCIIYHRCKSIVCIIKPYNARKNLPSKIGVKLCGKVETLDCKLFISPADLSFIPSILSMLKLSSDDVIFSSQLKLSCV